MRSWVLLAMLVVGCGGGLTYDAAETARLAQLPRVPTDPRVPSFPPELRGLTFRVNPRFDGGPPVNADAIAAKCVAQFEGWVGAAGWVPVRDPAAPVDLIVEEYCAAHLTMTVRPGLLEIQRPPMEKLAVVVMRDGMPVVTVARGPADYVCEANGTREEVRRVCEARAEAWGRANILSTLVASEPLAQLARQLAATRNAR